MTKAELLESVSSSTGVSRSQAENVLSEFFSTVVQAAKRGDKAGWPGFGTFSANKRGARTGRNPRTGEPVKIGASTALKFSASSTLKQEMNSKRSAKKATAKKSAGKAAAKKAPAKKAPAKKAAAKTTKSTAKTSKSTKSTAKKATAKKR